MSRTLNDYSRLILNLLNGLSAIENLPATSTAINVRIDSIINWFTLTLDLGSSPPSSGQVGTNASTLGGTTTLYISKTGSSSSALEGDRTILLGNLAGKVLYIGTAGKASEAYLSVSSVSDSGTFYTVGVTPLILTNTIAEGEAMFMAVYRT